MAKIKVTNVGAAEGHESVQVYVGAENRASENPLRELKAFGKTKLLKPGESEIMIWLISMNPLRRGYWRRVCTK